VGLALRACKNRKRKMDAELLKCKRTHKALSSRFSQSRRLLHMVCYLNDSGCDDAEFVDFKARCAEKLSFLTNKTLPKHNIAEFGLDSCNLALYHQCARAESTASSREDSPSEFKRVVEDWKRVVLGLDGDTSMGGIHDGFCKMSGFISYPKRATDEMMRDFVCPLCILTDSYTDIGWTDYVCPRPAGETSCSVSKRGVDKNLPTGACEHIMTVGTTKYDRLFE
jgi:hypothetical protein